MNLKDHRQALQDVVAADPASHEQAMKFVSFLRHELGNVVGTFTMETHMLGVLSKNLREAVESNDTTALAGMLDELEEMHENLVFASSRAAQFINDLRDT